MYEKPKLISDYDINIKKISSIIKEKHTGTWSYKKEFPKKMYKITCVLRGEYIAYANKRKYHLKENDILYSGGFENFASHSVSDIFSCIYIYFEIDEDETDEANFFTQFHFIENNEKLRKKFSLILNEYNSKAYNYKIKTKKIFYEILDDILEAKIKFNDKNIDIYALKNAIEYIEQNYFKNDISIDYLANLCNYTTAHFINLFKKIYNTTPKNYIINLRMEKAKDLLIYSPYSILEIAEITGYSNPAYFSAAFKTAVGCSPADYRKKNS